MPALSLTVMLNLIQHLSIKQTIPTDGNPLKTFSMIFNFAGGWEILKQVQGDDIRSLSILPNPHEPSEYYSSRASY